MLSMSTRMDTMLTFTNEGLCSHSQKRPSLTSILIVRFVLNTFETTNRPLTLYRVCLLDKVSDDRPYYRGSGGSDH